MFKKCLLTAACFLGGVAWIGTADACTKDLTATSKIADILYCMGQLEARIERASGVPRGAVMAFEIPCSQVPGWSDYNYAQGRFIVGVGRNEDQAGHAKSFSSGEIGGNYVVALTVDEMPPHAHGYVDYGSSPSGSCAFSGCNGRAGNISKSTAVAGGSGGATRPHQNTPPYVALYYCKKD